MAISSSLISFWAVSLPIAAFALFAFGVIFKDYFPEVLPAYKKILTWVPSGAALVAAGYLTFQSLTPLPFEAYPVILVLAILPAIIAAVAIHSFKLKTSPVAPFALSSAFLTGVLLLPGSNLGIALLLALGTAWLLKVVITHQPQKAA